MRSQTSARKIVAPSMALGASLLVSALLAGCGPTDQSSTTATPEATTQSAGPLPGADATTQSEPASPQETAGQSAAAGEFHGVLVTGSTGQEPTVVLSPDFTAPTNLLTKDLVVGEGQPVVDHAQVQMRYVGIVASTGEVYESTFASDASFVSIDDQIAGLTEGMLGMQAGGRRLLIMPAELGYGPSGLADKVGANEALVLVVDVQSVTAPE